MAAVEFAPFHKSMIERLMEDEDVLFVISKGLGLHRIMLHLLKIYSVPQFLVIVVNATDQVLLNIF